MWLLHFFPDTFVELVVDLIFWSGLLATIVACFLLKYLVRLLPTISPYTTLVQAGSVAVFLVGVYFQGSYSTEMAWRDRVKELEEQVAAAEQRSNEVNEEIKTKTVTQTKIIKQRGADIIQYVDREVVKYDTKFAPGGICEIPKEFITAHNRAAEAPTK
jgi:hypothetical protein